MLRKLKAGLVRLIAGVLFVALGGVTPAQEDADCLDCHGDPEMVFEIEGKQISIFVDVKHLKNSVHPEASCIDCHVDLDGVTDFPHAAKLKPAECATCHDDGFESIAAYWQGSHGKAVTAGAAESPRCHDCHGGHDIRRRTDPASPTFPGNVPSTCSKCHAEGQPIQRTEGLDRDAVAERYLDRIHGRAIFEQGLTVAPVCTTCHGYHGIKPPTDPASLIHKDKVNDGCATCHSDMVRVHRNIVQPELWERPGAVPICVDCHQPHKYRSVSYQTNMSDAECMSCHGDAALGERTGRPSLVVDVDGFHDSVHGRNLVACAQCHTSVSPVAEGRSCADNAAAVDCASCHATQVALHSRGVHGRLHEEGNADAPSCVDCHGGHTVLESRVPQTGAVDDALRARILASPTHRRNVADLCARCHDAGGPGAQNGDPNKVAHYRDSIHGEGLMESGLIVSANCVDCHTAHMELPAADPDSTVHPSRIADTCGQCHDGIQEQFRASIHSPHGNPDFRPAADGPHLPSCNECHSAHSIVRTDRPAFRRQIVGQCGDCHEEITETYFDTYHGKVTALGETVAAQCHDCHGSHGMRPVGDPASTLHPNNIVGTCASCHPGSHAGFTTVLSHANHKDPERYPALYWSYVLMSLLLLGVFGFFFVHLFAWLPRSWKVHRKHMAELAAKAGQEPASTDTRQYVRFRRFDRNLHRMIIVSFLGLALTGMTLKYSETGWARFLNEALGGTATMGWIHRVCAIITFSYMGLHLWDLFRRFRKSGLSLRQFFLNPETTMIPTWNDVKELLGTFRWFFGLGPRPHYGKWTYWEKFDYFAVFWGVVIIGLSGLILWFPEISTRLLPGWAVNVATIIHSEEALLATGFIFTIHFFNTHLRPEKFPMDPVVFTGSMTVEELRTDKPRLYEQLVASGELEKHLVDPPSPARRRAAYIFGWTALTIGIAIVILLVHGLITVGM